jgi:D-arabinose 5-phosphate isomerase GutQ
VAKDRPAAAVTMTTTSVSSLGQHSSIDSSSITLPSKKKTETNMLVSAVDNNHTGNSNTIAAIMQQHQLSEEMEWK